MSVFLGKSIITDTSSLSVKGDTEDVVGRQWQSTIALDFWSISCAVKLNALDSWVTVVCSPCCMRALSEGFFRSVTEDVINPKIVVIARESKFVLSKSCITIKLIACYLCCLVIELVLTDTSCFISVGYRQYSWCLVVY